MKDQRTFSVSLRNWLAAKRGAKVLLFGALAILAITGVQFALSHAQSINLNSALIQSATAVATAILAAFEKRLGFTPSAPADPGAVAQQALEAFAAERAAPAPEAPVVAAPPKPVVAAATRSPRMSPELFGQYLDAIFNRIAKFAPLGLWLATLSVNGSAPVIVVDPMVSHAFLAATAVAFGWPAFTAQVSKLAGAIRRK